MTENGSVIITITFGIIYGLTYLTGIVMALLSWRKYRFSWAYLLPIVLIPPICMFSFPIYTYAELRQRKKTGDRVPAGKLKFYSSWLPAIAGWLSSLVFSYSMDYILNKDEVNLLFDSTISSFITLLFVAAFIWLGYKLDKMTTYKAN